MNLWQEFSQKNQKESAGISFRYEKGVDEALKQEYIRFGNWLRQNYVFPKHLTVFVRDAETVTLKNGTQVYGKFRWYEKRNPRIEIPSSLLPYISERRSADEIHDSILSSLVHEITHYFQWVKGLEQSNATSERQANYYRYRILDDYYEDINETLR